MAGGTSCYESLNPDSSCYSKSVKHYVDTRLGLCVGFRSDYNDQVNLYGDGNAQCAALARDYFHYITGFKAGANGCAWLNPYIEAPGSLAGITVEYNGASNYPSVGDIVSFSCAMPGTGGAGHVAIVVCANAFEMTVLEQNTIGTPCGGGGKSAVLNTYYDWTYVQGWLHFSDSMICERGNGYTPPASCDENLWTPTGEKRQVGSRTYCKEMNECGDYREVDCGEWIPPTPAPTPEPVPCIIKTNFCE